MQDNDSGTAAVMVSPELKELRSTCDRLDIKWHHRNSGITLQTKIDTKVDEDIAIASGMETTEAIRHPKKPKPKPRPKRTIPHHILGHLGYMRAYRKAYADEVMEYIESIL